MSGNVRTTVTIDEDVKAEASEVLREMGLTLSGGIELFLRAVIREQGLPFPVTTKPNVSYHLVALPELDGNGVAGKGANS